jgi:hypothetical protein
MKMNLSIFGTALAALVGLASAAPAIVWKNHGGDSSSSSSSSSLSSSSRTSHISDATDARSLLASVAGKHGQGDVVVDDDDDSSALSAVVFLVGRNADGSEGLASLVSSEKMAGVQERYLVADEIYYHVRGVESPRTVARDIAAAAAATGRESGAGKRSNTVAEVSMEEFQRKLASMAQSEVVVDVAESSSETKRVTKAEQKRRRAISEADVLVVNVGANEDAAKLDAAVIAAIDSSAVRNVVLSSIRSTDEVKRARMLAVAERLTQKRSSAGGSGSSSSRRRRRLEDVVAEEDNNNAQDMTGIYYVNMTPNILAGLLFFFMFVITAHIGLSCMNMIEGQDVYVKKMPHIGREV